MFLNLRWFGFARLTSLLLITALSIAVAPNALAAGPEASPEKEQELLSVLRSDAPAADKAITCKQLAIYGSSESVSELAKLLTDPQLASWARIALEAIPDPAADAALREATERVEGLLLIGTINSIGVRRDADSSERLATLLRDEDADVASAAAVALGRIGTALASETLRQALSEVPAEVRSAVAEGCVLSAEQLLAAGDRDAAIALYDLVREADVPKQRVIEATRGAILARNQDGIPLLLEQLHSPDKAMFQLALGTVREFPGDNVDKALAEELGKLPAERAALVIVAMSDRPESVVLPAVLQAATQGSPEVRLAAIGALGRVGNVDCLTPLLEIAAKSESDFVESAKRALAELPGTDVNSAIVEKLASADGTIYPLLIELVGRRRIDATPLLEKALDNADPQVRAASLAALGETISFEKIPLLITRVTSSAHVEDLEPAMQALRAASIRMPDREACAEKLAEAMEQAGSGATKSNLLEILGFMGGTKALQTVGAAAAGTDEQLQDVSSRLLGEWMTADAAPVLLELAKTLDDPKYQVRAMRGYIRIARQFVLPDAERVEMCRQALDAAARPEEQRLVFDVLVRYPTLDGLKLAIDATKIAAVKDEATNAARQIVDKLRGRQKGEGQRLLTEAGLG